jgi:hypothetical protein
MISPLESQPLNLVMEMLENIAKSNDLLLSTNLIDFADDIYKIAYERGMEDANRHTFVYDPERDGPAEFVPPKSLQIALESHEQHHAQAKEKFPNLFDEFAERAPKDVQEAMIKILNARTTRAKHEQGLDKV